LLDDGLFSYTYDTANRLTQVVSDTLTTEYIYNGDGVRIAQIQDGLRTDYVQDIAAILPQLLTARQGGTVSRYLRGLGLIGEQTGGSGPFAAPAAWQYHLPDALGSVRQTSDPAGQVLLTRRYDPFGGLQNAIGIARSSYGFAGEEQDPDTDQLFLRARTYNPATGRFLQPDSLIGQPGQPNTRHRYAYAFNLLYPTRIQIAFLSTKGHAEPQRIKEKISVLRVPRGFLKTQFIPVCAIRLRSARRRA
jgi:RHS repeat-associated protein